ncbi:hypothetical protein Tco_0287443 [Tanacetum coccineum]
MVMLFFKRGSKVHKEISVFIEVHVISSVLVSLATREYPRKNPSLAFSSNFPSQGSVSSFSYTILFRVIIEQLAKDGKENVFWNINDEDQESLLNLKNMMYHSRWICYFSRLRQDQDHCLTLKNTSYSQQQIRRIRYFGQHLEEARFTANTPYSEDPICRILWRSSNKELVEPYGEPEQALHSLRKLFKTTSFDHSSSPEFKVFSDHEEQVEEEITKTDDIK